MSSLRVQVWCLRLESLTIDGRSGLPQPATGGMMRNGWTSAKIHAPSQRKQIHRVWRDCVNDVKIPEHTLPSLKHLSVYPIICHPKSTCAWPMERSNLQMKGRSEQEFQMTSILRSCKLRMLIRLWWLVVSHHNSELLSCQAVYWDLLGLRSYLAFGSSKIPGPGGSHQPTTGGWLDIVDCLAFLKLNPSMFRGFQRDLSWCIHRICITGDFNIWVWVNTY